MCIRDRYKFYDVDNIIRIGSAGSYTDKAKLFDVVLAAGAVSESNYARVQSLSLIHIWAPTRWGPLQGIPISTAPT